ncbi:hypothetical protein KDL45_03675, partial [bacterium]|nr:hypothetical protein [bacterium]
DDDDTTDDDTADDDISDDDDDDVGSPFIDPNLTVLHDEARKWICETSCECGAEYLAAAPYLGDPSKAVDIFEWRDNKDSVQVMNGRPKTDEFIATMTDLAAFDVDSILEQPLTVTVTEQNILSSGVTEQVLIVNTARVGEFTARVLIPATPGPWPVITALPGHGISTDEQYFYEGNGKRYAEEGYLIGAINLRVMCGEPDEQEATIALLDAGSTLTDVQAEEALLLYRYLGSLEGADTHRMGLSCHSGGCAPAGVLAWVGDGLFDAVVIDNPVTFGEFTYSNLPLNQTVPKYYPYYEWIYDYGRMPQPGLGVEYGTFSHDTALNFFDANLKK